MKKMQCLILFSLLFFSSIWNPAFATDGDTSFYGTSQAILERIKNGNRATGSSSDSVEKNDEILDVVAQLISLWGENEINISLPQKGPKSQKYNDRIFDEYIISDDFKLSYCYYRDGTNDILTLYIPSEMSARRTMFGCSISIMCDIPLQSALQKYDELVKAYNGWGANIKLNGVSIDYSDFGNSLALQFFRDLTYFDKSQTDTLTLALEKQEKIKNDFRITAEIRLREYWNVVMDDFELVYDAKNQSISIMKMYLTWKTENGKDQTKKMLEMYSDDMAATLHEAYRNIPIDQFVVFWKVPYILKNGNAAKYYYTSKGDFIYHTDSLGFLYGKE